MYAFSEDLAEECGIHIGDGSMNIYNKIYCYTLAVHHIDDKDYLDYHVIPLYKKLFKINIKPRMWSKGTYGFRIHNKELVKFKHIVLKLPLGPKKQITVPEFILKSKKYKIRFLQGLVSTDGSLNTFLANKKQVYSRIQFTNTSHVLMKIVNNILTELDFKFSSWTVYKNHPRWSSAQITTINGYKFLKKWTDEIGFVNPKQINLSKKLLYKGKSF